MGPLGWQETVFIFILALLIFGPKKLPELGRTIGKAMTEFRRASSELKSTFDREMASIEREGESLREVTQSYSNEISNSYYDHQDSSYYDSEAYGSDSHDSTSAESSTVSASAPQGADSTAADSSAGAAPEGQLPSDTGELPALAREPSAEPEAPQTASNPMAESESVKS